MPLPPANPIRFRVRITPAIRRVLEWLRRDMPLTLREEILRFQYRVSDDLVIAIKDFHLAHVGEVTGGSYLSIRRISGYHPKAFTRRWFYVGYYPLRRVNPLGPDAGRPPGPLAQGYVRPWQTGVPAGRVHSPRRGIKMPGTIWLPRLIFWMKARGISIGIRGTTGKGTAKTFRKEQRRGRPGRRKILTTLSPKQAAWVIARSLEKFGIRPHPIFGQFLSQQAAKIRSIFQRHTEIFKRSIIAEVEERFGAFRRMPEDFWSW